MPHQIVPPNTQYPWYIRVLFWLQKKKYSEILESSKVWARSPSLFLGLSGFYAALNRKKHPIPIELRALITVRVSQINHCDFCIDLNSHRTILISGAENKLNQLPTFRLSDHYTEQEKIALIYAEQITYTEQEVEDETYLQLKKFYTEDEIVELTAIIAFQNLSSKFNHALKIPSQGFCKKNR